MASLPKFTSTIAEKLLTLATDPEQNTQMKGGAQRLGGAADDEQERKQLKKEKAERAAEEAAAQQTTERATQEQPPPPPPPPAERQRPSTEALRSPEERARRFAEAEASQGWRTTQDAELFMRVMREPAAPAPAGAVPGATSSTEGAGRTTEATEGPTAVKTEERGRAEQQTRRMRTPDPRTKRELRQEGEQEGRKKTEENRLTRGNGRDRTPAAAVHWTQRQGRRRNQSRREHPAATVPWTWRQGWARRKHTRDRCRAQGEKKKKTRRRSPEGRSKGPEKSYHECAEMGRSGPLVESSTHREKTSD